MLCGDGMSYFNISLSRGAFIYCPGGGGGGGGGGYVCNYCHL